MYSRTLPPSAADDNKLMNIILQPPKEQIATGCYHVTNKQLNRSEILLSQVSQWVEVMNNDLNEHNKSMAKLKLLLFFASEEALNMFLALHSQYQE
jgi:hypothetical protein